MKSNSLFSWILWRGFKLRTLTRIKWRIEKSKIWKSLGPPLKLSVTWCYVPILKWSRTIYTQAMSKVHVLEASMKYSLLGKLASHNNLEGVLIRFFSDGCYYILPSPCILQYIKGKLKVLSSLICVLIAFV